MLSSERSGGRDNGSYVDLVITMFIISLGLGGYNETFNYIDTTTIDDYWM